VETNMPTHSRTISSARYPAIAATVTGLIMAAASAGALAAQAAPADSDTLEEVTITGTSIRGSAPVGNNLITVSRESIGETGAQTVQQILQNVPAVTGFGNAAQGGFGSADGSGTFAPTIHGLGASASNGTLVLIDGHRLPLTGLNHTLADPNIIAALAVERVEVLPDGASSTYGSDAVAGVINFITRRNFKGFEASAQAGFGNEYSTQSAGFLWGDAWDQSSVMLSYDYSRRSALRAGDRSFTAADHRAQGGGNFASLACGQATVNNIQFPYTGAAVASANAPCDYTGVADLLPENIRHSLLLKATHDFNDRVSFSSDTVFSKEANTAAISRGSVSSIRTFGTGNAATTQINPFFQGPTGVNSATVSWDANALLGPGAKNSAGNQVVMNSSGLQVKMGGDWVGALGFTLGTAESNLLTTGTICSSCAILALNGTTSSGGSTAATTQPGTPGTGIGGTVLNLPLTINNALDVWNAGAGNRTSAAVLAELTDSATAQNTHQTLQDFSLKFDGSLFAMPGGEAKAAVGAEFLRYQLSQQVIRSRNTGPSSQNSSTTFLGYGRNVTSGYAELLLPIFGEGNATAFAKRFDINLSGRFDKYSDFGNTTNPKLAFTWSVNNSVSMRGNYAKSFTAPALTSRGNADGTTAESSYAINSFTNVSIPNSYPNAIGLPGCTAATPTCLLGATVSTGSGLVNVTGIQLNGGNKNLKPEKGTSWSVGLDLTPSAVDGLGIHLTYWNAKYEGMITAASSSFAIGSPGLQNNLRLFPGNGGLGATTAEIAAATAGLPAGGVLPSAVYYIFSFQQSNALNLNAAGLDFDIAYKFNTGANTTWSADLSGSRKLKMDQQFGVGGAWFSVLNTAGINTTFPSVATSLRLNLGLKTGDFKVNLFTNYSGAYTNRNDLAPFRVIRSATFAPIGGGQPVDSLMTFDVHASYSLPDSGVLSKAELNFDVSNLTDKQPPFFNVAQGYDGFGGNPIGRVYTIGLSKKW
jgi:iron complex outermembrane receptor protein